MRISVKVTVSDAGFMHERTYEAAVQLVLTTNVEQAEATAKAVQRGAEGAAEATTALRKGKTPQEVKDANDRAWR